jgi:hypothetical protein
MKMTKNYRLCKIILRIIVYNEHMKNINEIKEGDLVSNKRRRFIVQDISNHSIVLVDRFGQSHLYAGRSAQKVLNHLILVQPFLIRSDHCDVRK